MLKDFPPENVVAALYFRKARIGSTNCGALISLWIATGNYTAVRYLRSVTDPSFSRLISLFFSIADSMTDKYVKRVGSGLVSRAGVESVLFR